MVGPLRIDGMFSGLDVSGIVEKLLSAYQRPLTRYQNEIAEADQEKAAFLQLNANLLGLKGSFDLFSRPSYFNKSNVTSSSESLLRASGPNVSNLGSYSFSSRRLAATHQVISNGFANSATAPVTTEDSVITLEVGGGQLLRETRLSSLNGGEGVDLGSIQITDSSGASAIIDLEGAVTVSDVLETINGSFGVNVDAYVEGDRISVRDLGGGLAGSFRIQNVGKDNTATDLGLTGTGVAGSGGNYIYGSAINFLTAQSSHLDLNDGLGVRRNSDGLADLQIAGPDGVTFSVDLQSVDVTVESILTRINDAATAAGSSVTAALGADNASIQLNGTGDQGLSITRMNDSFAAVDLGLGVIQDGSFVQLSAENGDDGSVAAGGDVSQRLAGRRLIGTLDSTLRSLLNGGQGHDDSPASVTALAAIGDDVIKIDSAEGFSVGDRVRISEGGVVQLRRIRDIDGTSLTLDQGLSTAITGAATVSNPQGISDGSITVTDRQGDSFTFDISSRVSAQASAGALTGDTSLTLDSVDGFSVGNQIRMVSNGVQQVRTVTAVDTGTNTVTFDAALTADVALGAGVQTGHDSLGQILTALNDRAGAEGVEVRFEIDAETNGLKVVDFSGGLGTLSVADSSGTAAAELGIAGTGTGNNLDGEDIDVQYLSEFTELSTLNSGKGVYAGKIRITDTNGTAFTVDLSQSNDTNIGAVINDINGAASANGSAVEARINNTGDGILLTDTAAGLGSLRVEESGNGRTAADLMMLGNGDSGHAASLNASYEKRIELDAGATLDDVKNAINGTGLAVTATIVNDGRPNAPFRLVTFGNVSGSAGRFVLDSEIAGLDFETTTEAQDAVLLFGSPGGDPLQLTSGSNRFSNVVPGLTIDLVGASRDAVTVNVSRDTEAIVSQAQKFVDDYNNVIGLIRELTFFDADTYQKGILFSDSTVRRIRQELAGLITRSVNEIQSGNLRSLQQLGFSLGEEGGLTLDTGEFRSAMESDFDQVRDLFTRQRQLKLDTEVDELNSGLGVHPLTGTDFTVKARDGFTSFDVDISPAASLGSILTAINTASGNNGAIEAEISADGFSIVLRDNTLVPDRAVDSGSSTTRFIENDLIGKADDSLVGATITFLSGANAGQIRTVSDFNGTTGEITLDSALPGTPLAGESYRLERAITVSALGDSPVASELKLLGASVLGQSSYKSGIINLGNDPGLGFQFKSALDLMTRLGDGMISTRTGTLDDTIEGLNDNIERMEERISRMEERYIKEFARLEVIIAQSQGTMSRLASSLGAMQSIGQTGGGA